MTINVVEDRYLNVRELARRYGRTVDGIYKMIRRGAFPDGVHIGSHRRWLLSKILEWEAGLTLSQAVKV